MSLKPIQPNTNQSLEPRANSVDKLIGQLLPPAIKATTGKIDEFIPEAYRPDTREMGAKNNSRVTVQVEEPQKGFSFFA